MATPIFFFHRFFTLWLLLFILTADPVSFARFLRKRISISNIMHQSIPGASSSPSGYCREIAGLVSPGGGAFANFVLPGVGHLPTPGPFPSFCHARGFLSEYNYADDYTGKESGLTHLSWTGKN